MPTVHLDRKEIERVIGSIPEDKLKERISMLGTDLEELTPEKIVVEIFPNRPDMLSEQGFARAMSSFLRQKMGLREYTSNDSDYELNVEIVKNRPKISCAVVKGLKLNEERLAQMIQLQEKLHVTYGRNRKKAAIGIYPLNKIIFPLIYTEEKDVRFTPLESVEMNASEILQNHPKGKEFGHLIQGKFPLIKDSSGNVLSMPPIINSNHTGKVLDDTKDIFIECTGHDQEVLNRCVTMIVSALGDMGGQIFNVKINYKEESTTTPDLSIREKEIDINYINRILGLELSEEEVKDYLSMMGFGYKNKRVLIPAYRADILHPIDFVEDIAIAYGYENFTEEIPKVATIGAMDRTEKFLDIIRDIMIGCGLEEVKNYHLVTEEMSQKMGCSPAQIQLANAIGEHSYLRDWITPNLMHVLSINQHNEYPQNIFEIGRVFTDRDTHTGIREEIRLAVGLCNEDTDFTRIKQVLDIMAHGLGFKYGFQRAQHPSFIQGRVGRVLVNEKKIAYIGEIHPKIIEKWGFSMPVAVMEINLTELISLLDF